METPSPSILTVSNSPAPGNRRRKYHIDEALNEFDSFNPYIVGLWLEQSVIWMMTALGIMSSTFTMGTVCDSPTGNCTNLDNNGTATEEFNLSGKVAAWAVFSPFLLGTAIGGLVFPFLSDQRGRRPVVDYCLFFTALSGLASSFAPEVFSFMALRALQGFFYMGCATTAWVLGYESVPMRIRSFTALVFGLTWVVGYCLIALFAYWLPHWRHLTQLYSSILLVYSLFLFLTSAESFHWMVLHGKRRDVNRWIKKANRSARIFGCGKQVSITYDQIETKRTEDRDGESPWQLLKSNHLFQFYNFVMLQLFNIDAFVYYGLSIFTEQLKFDKYWKHTFTGLVEIPSYVLAPYMLDKWVGENGSTQREGHIFRMGRRPTIALLHVIVPLSLLTINFIDNPTWNIIAWMVGKFAIASSYTCLFVYGSEVFPTVTRNACMGIFLVSAHIAATFAPLMPTLASIASFLPTLTYSVLSLISAAIIWVLPETVYRQLPDHAYEMLTTKLTRRLFKLD